MNKPRVIHELISASMQKLGARFASYVTVSNLLYSLFQTDSHIKAPESKQELWAIVKVLAGLCLFVRSSVLGLYFLHKMEKINLYVCTYVLEKIVPV